MRTLNIVRRIFELPSKTDTAATIPPEAMSRLPVPSKQLHLPTQEQFREMAHHIEPPARQVRVTEIGCPH